MVVVRELVGNVRNNTKPKHTTNIGISLQSVDLYKSNSKRTRQIGQISKDTQKVLKFGDTENVVSAYEVSS